MYDIIGLQVNTSAYVSIRQHTHTSVMTGIIYQSMYCVVGFLVKKLINYLQLKHNYWSAKCNERVKIIYIYSISISIPISIPISMSISIYISICIYIKLLYVYIYTYIFLYIETADI